MSTVDPVNFEVIWHKLMQLAEDMGIAYFRTTASHVVITGTDASSAIMTPDAEAVAIGPFIVTQANVLPLIVKSVKQQCVEKPGINPGDVFICNDPYAGAIHQPDIASVAPIFDDEEIVAWVGTSGHQVDNGGIEPGGFSISATEIHQEGLRIPPVKLVDRGELREDLLRWIDNQVRDPLVALDVRAQVATINVGVRRMHELLDRYGPDKVTGTMQGIIDYAEERFAEKLTTLPDGRWTQSQYIDHDGHAQNIYRIECAVEKAGDRLIVDFGGTSANAPGIINATYAGLSAGTLSAAYILLAHDLPWNSGIRRRIDLRAAPGTVNNSAYPAPCTMATISATIVTIDAVWSCLSQMLLESDDSCEAMANWSGTSMAPVFSGTTRSGEPFVHTEMSHFGGGGGARVYKDGVDTAGIVFNTTPNIPNIEVNEQDFPVLYLFRRHLCDSGGPGRFRGGMSGELAYVAHKSGAPMESLFAGTGCYQPNAMGIAGGLPGAAVRVARVLEAGIGRRHGQGLPVSLEETTGRLEILEPKHPRSPFGLEDIWYHSWQGGGGYGDPIERPRELVSADVRNGAVSAGAARDIYGVALVEGEVDDAATRRRRLELRAERLGRRVPDERVRSAGSGARGGGAIRIDAGGRASCSGCGDRLGDGGIEQGRAAARVIDRPISAAGPSRGQDYGDHGFQLRQLVCPGCGKLLHTELRYQGDRLVPPPAASSKVVPA
jgi:N-methylhydantoinase B